MPTVSELLALKLQIDASGLSAEIESALRRLDDAKRSLEQRGSVLERIAKSLGSEIETAIKNVAGFFGVVLSFEGFRRMVVDAAQAGSAMGRFAESIGSTVEQTQKYQQAFRALAGEDTGILRTLSAMQTDLTRMQQGFGYTDWMKKLMTLPGYGAITGREKPEELLERASRSLEQNRITPAGAAAYLPPGLTQSDILLLTKPGELQRALEKQRTEVGTPTTPQAEAMEKLQEDIANVRTAGDLLRLSYVTMAEPLLHELLQLALGVLEWMRGVRTLVGGTSSPGAGVTLQPLPGRAPGGSENFNRGAAGRQPTGMAAPRPSGTPGAAPAAPGLPAPPAAPPSPGSLLRTAPPAAPPSVPAKRTETRAPTTPSATGGSSAVDLHRSGAPAAAVDDALKLEGLHERRDRDTIVQYLRTGGAGMDPSTTAWCAAFVNASLQREGVRGSGSAVATSFLRWGTGVSGGPEKGDVLVQSRGHGPGETGGHVGFATGRTRQGPAGTEYEMIAGNTKDSVLRYWIAASQVTVRRALPNVGTGAAPAASGADADRPVINRRESATSINQVIVNTHATSATGIADDVKSEIGRQLAPVE